MERGCSRTLFCILLITFGLSAAGLEVESEPDEEARLTARIDAVSRALKGCVGFPGLSLAVVRLDRRDPTRSLRLTRSYGVTGIESGNAVDDNTRFCIGSVTKGFTAALLAQMLADSNGTYSLETPVRSILGPDFELCTSERTQKTTIRDILSHRVGIAKHFGGFLMGYNFSRADIVRRVRHLPPLKPFRSSRVFNNFMYVIAGQITEKLNGTWWENQIADKFFKPLKMSHSTFADRVADWSDNFALPHALNNGKLVQLKPKVTGNILRPIGPAGSMCTSSKDMMEWLSMNLLNGTSHTGTPILSESVLNDMLQIHNMFPSPLTLKHDNLVGESLATGYGLGWVVGSYRDTKRVFHSGFSNYYYSMISLLPEKGIGIYASINGPHLIKCDNGMKALHFFIMDLLLGETPWLDESTVCAYPRPWKTATDLTKDAESSVSSTLPPSTTARPTWTFTEKEKKQISPVTVGADEAFVYDSFSQSLSTKLPQFTTSRPTWTVTEKEKKQTSPMTVGADNTFVYDSSPQSVSTKLPKFTTSRPTWTGIEKEKKKTSPVTVGTDTTFVYDNFSHSLSTKLPQFTTSSSTWDVTEEEKEQTSPLTTEITDIHETFDFGSRSTTTSEPFSDSTFQPLSDVTDTSLEGLSSTSDFYEDLQSSTQDANDLSTTDHHSISADTMLPFSYEPTSTSKFVNFGVLATTFNQVSRSKKPTFRRRRPLLQQRPKPVPATSNNHQSDNNFLKTIKPAETVDSTEPTVQQLSSTHDSITLSSVVTDTVDTTETEKTHQPSPQSEIHPKPTTVTISDQNTVIISKRFRNRAYLGRKRPQVSSLENSNAPNVSMARAVVDIQAIIPPSATVLRRPFNVARQQWQPKRRRPVITTTLPITQASSFPSAEIHSPTEPVSDWSSVATVVADIDTFSILPDCNSDHSCQTTETDTFRVISDSTQAALNNGNLKEVSILKTSFQTDVPTSSQSFSTEKSGFVSVSSQPSISDSTAKLLPTRLLSGRRPLRRKTRPKRDVTSDSKLTQFQGHYFNPFFGELVIAMNRTSKTLQLNYGYYGKAMLRPLKTETDHIFRMQFFNSIWYQSDSDDMKLFSKLGMFDVQFGVSKVDGVVDKLIVFLFDTEKPPLFMKHL